MDWIETLDRNLAAVVSDLPRLGTATEIPWLASMQGSIEDLQYRTKGIRKAVSIIPSPDTPAAPPPVDMGMASLISLSIPNAEEEKALQLNAFRIAILDLNQICEGLMHNFWASLLTRKHSGNEFSLVENFLGRGRVRPVLSESCDVLVAGGHGNLTTLRNALAHQPVRRYAREVDLRGSVQAGRPVIFEFAISDDEDSDYNRLVFKPLKQLGERPGGGEQDFSPSLRRDLFSALWSSGRITADVSAVFAQKIAEIA